MKLAKIVLNKGRGLNACAMTLSQFFSLFHKNFPVGLKGMTREHVVR